MQARLNLSKDECLNLLRDCYTELYQVPVEVTPVFPLLPNGGKVTVFFRMNESMLDENGFFKVLNQILTRAGFIIVQSITDVSMEQGIEFQGISVVIQKIAEVNLEVLPDWLRDRIKKLQFVDRIRTFQMRK